MKPTPKRPVFVPFDLSFFSESPMRWIDSKSTSVNCALLCASSAAPWNGASFANAKLSQPCCRRSKQNEISDAPASSAF